MPLEALGATGGAAAGCEPDCWASCVPLGPEKGGVTRRTDPLPGLAGAAGSASLGTAGGGAAGVGAATSVCRGCGGIDAVLAADCAWGGVDATVASGDH